MRRTSTFFLTTFIVIFPALGAQRSFVSGNGNDTNPCSHDLPCRSFSVAIGATAFDGEVVAIDSAGYGPVTISTAVTIVAPLGVHAGISVLSGDGVTVNAGLVDVVNLRNLYINSINGVNGITLNTAFGLNVEHCVVSGFSANDINLIPTVDAFVEISDTIARGASHGIYVNSAQQLRVSIDHCHMDMNNRGLFADQATSVTISNSVVNGNAVGLYSQGLNGPVNLGIEASVVSNNTVGVWVGTSLSVGAQRCTAHNTSVLNNINSGFFVGPGTLSLDNCVVAHGATGVRVAPGADVTITACTISDNSTAGVNQVGSSMARLSRNTITRNGSGIESTGSLNSTRSTGDNYIEGNYTADVGGNIITVASGR